MKEDKRIIPYIGDLCYMFSLDHVTRMIEGSTISRRGERGWILYESVIDVFYEITEVHGGCVVSQYVTRGENKELRYAGYCLVSFAKITEIVEQELAKQKEAFDLAFKDAWSKNNA